MKNELGNMEWYDSTLKTGTFYLHAIGEEFCLPLHFNGPKIRERLLFHFIVSGKGILKMKDNVWHLTANQGFIIPDSSIVFYQADKEDPWHYFWLRLTSEDADAFYKSLSLSPENPVYNARQNNEIYHKFKALFRAVSKDNTNPRPSPASCTPFSPNCNRPACKERTFTSLCRKNTPSARGCTSSINTIKKA